MMRHVLVLPCFHLLFVPLCAAPLRAEVPSSLAVSPPLVLPHFNNGETDYFLVFDPVDGSGRIYDRLGRDPRSIRVRPLPENLFEQLGRPPGQTARPGEILLAPLLSSGGDVEAALYVETPIGYAAYLEAPGKGGKLGAIVPLLGRRLAPIRAGDGRFLLLPRHDRAGRAVAAYLVHGPTGRGLHLEDLRKLDPQASVGPTSPLPELAGPIAAAELRDGDAATAAYLIADAASGTLHLLEPDPRDPATLAPRRLTPHLGEVFPADRGVRRVLAMGLDEDRRSTPDVLILDAVSGAAALLEAVLTAAPRLVDTQLRLDMWLAQDQRRIAIVPHSSSAHQILGLWLVEGASGAVIYLERSTTEGTWSGARVELEASR